MSKILISGCGITFSGERPTWSKVLRIAGYDITDLSGPAISNQLILNQLLQELHCNKYDHVVCQLTSFGKLDVQLNNHNAWLKDNDSLRNFSYKGFWPSSHSTEQKVKQDFQKYLYSPKLEEQDTIFKLLLLQRLCKESKTRLHIIQGYDLPWTDPLIDKLDFDKSLNIYGWYKDSKHYASHDHSGKNTVPSKDFQIKLAKFIAEKYLKDVKTKLERFDG